MFVYSVKTSKAKMIIIAAVIVAAAGVLVFFGGRGRGAETAQDGAISYSHSFRNSAGGSPRTPQRSAKSSSRRNSTRATRNTPR